MEKEAGNAMIKFDWDAPFCNQQDWPNIDFDHIEATFIIIGLFQNLQCRKKVLFSDSDSDLTMITIMIIF